MVKLREDVFLYSRRRKRKEGAGRFPKMKEGKSSQKNAKCKMEIAPSEKVHLMEGCHSQTGRSYQNLWGGKRTNHELNLKLRRYSGSQKIGNFPMDGLGEVEMPWKEL